MKSYKNKKYPTLEKKLPFSDSHLSLKVQSGLTYCAHCKHRISCRGHSVMARAWSLNRTHVRDAACHVAQTCMGAVLKRKFTVAAAFFGGGADSTVPLESLYMSSLGPKVAYYTVTPAIALPLEASPNQLRTLTLYRLERSSSIASCLHALVQKCGDFSRVTCGTMLYDCCVPLCNTNARRDPLFQYHY